MYKKKNRKKKEKLTYKTSIKYIQMVNTDKRRNSLVAKDECLG